MTVEKVWRELLNAAEMYLLAPSGHYRKELEDAVAAGKMKLQHEFYPQDQFSDLCIHCGKKIEHERHC